MEKYISNDTFIPFMEEFYNILAKAYPHGYMNMLSQQITEKIRKIRLPIFNQEQITQYRNKLEQGNKKYEMEKTDTKERFLHLIDAFYYLYSQEEDIKLYPIIEYIKCYQEIIEKLQIEEKYQINDTKLFHIMIKLKPDIDIFIGKYQRIIERETDTTTFEED